MYSQVMGCIQLGGACCAEQDIFINACFTEGQKWRCATFIFIVNWSQSLGMQHVRVRNCEG